MNEAILPLVGVVIGGTISSATTFGIERVKERRASRASARLVHDELLRASAQLGSALELGGPLPFMDGFATEVWRELRPVMARTLSTTTWGAVLASYAALASLRQSWSGPEVEPRSEFTEEGRAEVQQVRQLVRDALDALGRVGGVPSRDHEQLVQATATARAKALPEEL